MALYAFDGTGNEDKGKDKHGNDLDSNVLDFFCAYQDPDEASDPGNEFGSIYFKGIDTRARTPLGEKFAEALGIGGHKRIRQAMERLETTSNPATQLSTSSVSAAGRRWPFPSPMHSTSASRIWRSSSSACGIS